MTPDVDEPVGPSPVAGDWHWKGVFVGVTCPQVTPDVDEPAIKNRKAQKGWGLEMKNTVFILVTVVMLVTTGMVSSCAGVDKPVVPLEKVTIGISDTSLLPALVHIADEKGYFLEEGIDAEITGYPAGKFALAALFNGEVDVATVAETPIVVNSFDRNDFAIFVTILDSAQHLKALARKDRNISTPQDLIGKKLATTIGTTAHLFMSRFFILNGLDTADVEIVNMKPGEMVEAIVNGDVDAIFTWEPNILKAQESLGDNAIVLPSIVGYQATFNLVSKNDFIENNPELITRIIRALAKAEEFTESNRQESIAIMASRLETDTEDIAKIWDIYRFRLSLSRSLIVALENAARWAIANNMTDKTAMPNYLDFIYFDGLEAVSPEAVTIIH